MSKLLLQSLVIGCAFLSCTFTNAQSVDKELDGLFDGSVEPFTTADALPSWSALLGRIIDQKNELDQCITDESRCEGRLKSVHHLLSRGQELNREQRVRLVNRYINRFSRYRDDRRRDVPVGETTVRIGQEWSTLIEFLRRGGDCEDYATAKYQLLRLFGIPSNELRVVVIYDRAEREHHAIVGVANVDGKTVLLDTDNQTYRRRPSMYQFVYALNEDYVWDFGVEKTRLKGSVRRALRDSRSTSD
ncbi:MAG: transglutaminase-like cysteine peptidase [Gammaproteobacteria bacterium]|nr:transglutaminase-like cysteine peptidase [Gammaproteobacteria bacterium]